MNIATLGYNTRACAYTYAGPCPPPTHAHSKGIPRPIVFTCRQIYHEEALSWNLSASGVWPCMTMSAHEDLSGEIPFSPEQLTWLDRLIEAHQATEDPGHSASSSANSTTTATTTVAAGTSALGDGLVTTASRPGKISLFFFLSFVFCPCGSGARGVGSPGQLVSRGRKLVLRSGTAPYASLRVAPTQGRHPPPYYNYAIASRTWCPDFF